VDVGVGHVVVIGGLAVLVVVVVVVGGVIEELGDSVVGEGVVGGFNCVQFAKSFIE